MGDRPQLFSKKRIKALGVAAIGFASGIGVGFSATWVWDYHAKPKIHVQMAMGVVEWTQEISGDSAILTTTLTDRYTGELAVRLAGIAPRTLVGPFAGEHQVVIKVLLRNSGKTAATNLQIPIYVNRPGEAWIDYSPHIAARLTSNPNHRLPFRVDGIRIASLPPHTPAVVTYHFEIDERTWEHTSYDEPLEWKVRPPIADEVGPLEVEMKEVPLGAVAIQENKIGMVGRPVLVQRFRLSGGGGPLVMCVDSSDAWYKQIVTRCGGRGPADP